MNAVFEEAAVLHPCVCCGYRTLEQEPPGTWLVCAICSWQDTGCATGHCPTNGSSLRVAQRRFLEIGAISPEHGPYSRAPTEADQRVEGWRTLEAVDEEARAKALVAIEEAFGELRYQGGMRIYHAELADDYGMPSERSNARRDDTYMRWQDIPDAVIGDYNSVLSFFDAEGLRLHLPAYMRFTLRHAMSDSMSVDTTVWALCPPPGAQSKQRAWWEGRFEGFDAAQREAVRVFLRWVADHSDHLDGDAARKALEAYWDEGAP